MNELNEKVVLVTGASKGIGKAIAIELAKAGAKVAIHYNTDDKGAQSTLAEIESSGGEGFLIKADLSLKDQVEALFKKLIELGGGLDVLVNNAGVYKFGPLELIDQSDFDFQMKANVLAPLLCIQNAVKLFGDKGGSIINVSSVASTKATAYTSMYTATKSALNGLTESLAQELGPKQIRVNAVLPGPTLTEGTKAIGLDQVEQQKGIIAQTALGRMGTINDIAKVVLFLASDKADWVTGQKIEVTGGF